MFDTVIDNSVTSAFLAYEKGSYLKSLMSAPVCSQLISSLTIPLTFEAVMGDRYLVELGNLEEDWDGYGAASISANITARSREAFASLARQLPTPEISPNSNGTISFEWSTEGGDAQLEIGDKDISFYLSPAVGKDLFFKGDISSSVMTMISSFIGSELFPRSVVSHSMGTFYMGASSARL